MRNEERHFEAQPLVSVGEERLLYWYDGGEESDGVLVDSDAMIPTFDSAQAAGDYAGSRGLNMRGDNGTPPGFT